MKVLKIRGNPHGFFSSFLGVLDNLIWCDRNSVAPVVEFDERTRYWVDGGYHGSINPWEYYFEPIMAAIGEGAEVMECFNTELAKEVAHSFGYRNTKGFLGNLTAVVSPAIRRSAHQTIKKYVAVNEPIAHKVQEFQEAHFKKPMLGVHLRGARHSRETFLPDNPPLEWYRQAIHQFVENRKPLDYGIFVASGTREALRYIEQSFPNVVYRDCFRVEKYYGRGNRGVDEVHEPNRDNMAVLGEEVLIDCLLLSQCNALFHHESNVAIAAAYFNPELETIHVEQHAPTDFITNLKLLRWRLHPLIYLPKNIFYQFMDLTHPVRSSMGLTRSSWRSRSSSQ
jgi:hypothetical protein